MRISVLRFVALLAGLFFASYLAAFLLQRHAVAPISSAIAPAVDANVRHADDETPRASVDDFAQTADRVTMGSGILPESPSDSRAEYDRLLRQTAALPDGEEKMQLAQQVGAIRDPAAAPVLLDWAVVTTDRVLLRSALDALGPLGDAELIAEIQRRFAAAFRADDRFRLAKVIRNITNPESVPALIELANDALAPEPLIIAATEALATLATPPAVSLLLGKIDTVAPDDTGRLMTAIARIDRTEALALLQYAALGNKDAPSDLARVAAIQALANFRDEQTRELLQRLGGDPNADVRDAAREVLARSR